MNKEVKIVNPVFMITVHPRGSGTGLNWVSTTNDYLKATHYARKASLDGDTVNLFEIAREINFEPIDTTTLNEGVENE